MSMITKAAGLDPLIKAAKARDHKGVLDAVETLIRKYAGGTFADAFRLAVSLRGD